MSASERVEGSLLLGFVVVVVSFDVGDWRREGEGSKPLMEREGRARVRERRIYCEGPIDVSKGVWKIGRHCQVVR